MADLIDRDAVLAEIGEFQIRFNETGDSHERVAYASAEHCMLVIKAAPAVNRWIPCSERMPEENVYVIAWAKRKHYSKAIMAILINGIWKIGVNDCSDGFHVQGEITHWMLLPEPPKGGTEDA